MGRVGAGCDRPPCWHMAFVLLLNGQVCGAHGGEAQVCVPEAPSASAEGSRGAGVEAEATQDGP